MRTSSKWLRFGLTSLIVGSAGFGAFLVACSDDEPAGGSPAADSGSDTYTPPPSNDSGADAPAPKPEPARLQVVNAASDLGPANVSGLLRICYEVAPGVFPLPALPDTKVSDKLPFPGIPIGTGGVADTTGASLETLNITPYVMNAQALAGRGIVKGDAGNAGMGCGDLIGADKDAGGKGPLVEGVDYWKLPVLSAGQFKNEKSYILVLSGCVANSELGTDKCGADFVASENPGVGNLKLTVHEVDRATKIDATKIGTQFIHASPQAAAALGEAGGVNPGYVSAADGGFTAVSTPQDGGVPVHTATGLVQVEGVNAAADKFTANPLVADLGIPLALVQALTYGGATPPAGGAIANGAAFTFIAVGDPTPDVDADAGGNFNTRKFHYLALPNNPTPKIYGK